MTTSPRCSSLFWLLCLCVLPVAALAQAPKYKVEKDIAYLEPSAAAAAGDYAQSQCRLDLYVPQGVEAGFPTVVWFHGGGLKKGRKSGAAYTQLRDQGYAVVAVGYRLAPPGNHPDYLNDAAAATAWVMRNIAEHGGDPKKVFIGGMSAGGYLAAMVGMDPRWLAQYGLSNRDLAGVIPVSGQVTTHFYVKELLGYPGNNHRVRPIIDELAPLFYVSADLPPFCLIVGDRKLDWPGRMEENLLLEVSLRNSGHTLVEFHEIEGTNHSTVMAQAWAFIPPFISRVLSLQAQPAGE